MQVFAVIKKYYVHKEFENVLVGIQFPAQFSLENIHYKVSVFLYGVCLLYHIITA